MPAIALWVIFWILFHAAIVAAIFGNQALRHPPPPHHHPPPLSADRQPLLGAAPPRFVQTILNAKPMPISIPIPKPKPKDDDADDTWEYLSRTI